MEMKVSESERLILAEGKIIKIDCRTSDASTTSQKYRLKNGFSVTFLGVDGAGKTTLADDVYAWLNEFFVCHRLSMGIGRQAKNKSSKETDSYTSSKLKQKTKLRSKMGLLKFAYFIHKDILSMRRDEKRGEIYVLDRYPQTECFGISDGPKIDSPWILSTLEKTFLNIANKIQPTVVFKINIPLSVSIERRPEDNPDVLSNKINVLNKIKYSHSEEVEIDGCMPYDEELSMIKQMIWDRLCGMEMVHNE